eukprot:6099521-Amphidinium_carterae.1
MGAQSISSGSSSSSSLDGQVIVAMESLMWDSLASQQCAAVVLQRLLEGELTAEYNRSGKDILKTLTTVSNTATLQRDSFIPTASLNDTTNYLWFTWLTEAAEAQYNDFNTTAQVPGYKDNRGDNVHKHH